MRRVLQLLGWGGGLVLAWVSGLGMCSSPPGSDRFDPDWAVYATGRLFVGFWALGSAQLLWLRPAGWQPGETQLRLALLTVWLAVLAHLIHLLAAFGLVHDFSHARAVEHTARTAGVGWGVYVNYLFTAVWLADAVWLAAGPRGYARRPRWVGRTVHGFLAVIVFNATVVYAEPATRLAGGVWVALLGVSWWRRGRVGRPATPAGSAGSHRPLA